MDSFVLALMGVTAVFGLEVFSPNGKNNRCPNQLDPIPYNVSNLETGATGKNLWYFCYRLTQRPD